MYSNLVARSALLDSALRPLLLVRFVVYATFTDPLQMFVTRSYSDLGFYSPT
jgi:hypothetical protein